MTGIICALKIEVDGLKSAMDSSEKKTIAGLDFISGKINDKDVVLLANHGLVAAGKSVSQAFSKAEAVEKLAKIVIASEALGPDLPLSAVEKEKLLEVYKARKD